MSGSSGSGKTTTLNVRGGLDRVDTARVLLDGIALSELGTAELAQRRLAKNDFVLQACNLVPVLSVAENVAFILELQGVVSGPADARARAMLRRVEQADRRPGELSGGQQQRVAVAWVLVTEPQVVLADEPTANLDTKTALSLLDLLAELNEDRGVTMVFSTHDVRVMERARTVVRMPDHRIVDIDSSPDAA